MAQRLSERKQRMTWSPQGNGMAIGAVLGLIVGMTLFNEVDLGLALVVGLGLSIGAMVDRLIP